MISVYKGAMRVRCNHCGKAMEVPASEYFRAVRSKAGAMRTPKQIAARSANITAYNERRRAERELINNQRPRLPIKNAGRRERPKRKMKTVLEGAVETVLKGPYRSKDLIERDGKRLRRAMGLRSDYSCGLLQLVYERSRRYCRARTEKSEDVHKGVIANHCKHACWPNAWSIEYGEVDLPPKSELIRFNWVSRKAVWVVRRDSGDRVIVYCCEMM